MKSTQQNQSKARVPSSNMAGNKGISITPPSSTFIPPQLKEDAVQKQGQEEEEMPAQGKEIQMQQAEEEEPMQGKEIQLQEEEEETQAKM